MSSLGWWQDNTQALGNDSEGPRALSGKTERLWCGEFEPQGTGRDPGLIVGSLKPDKSVRSGIVPTGSMRRLSRQNGADVYKHREQARVTMTHRADRQ